MVTTICFLDDGVKAFRETAGVLRAVGVFVIGFVDKDSPPGLIYQQHKKRNRFHRQATFSGATEVIDLLRHPG